MPISTDYQGFRLEIDVISTLTFNMPGVNILSTPVLNDLVSALRTLEAMKNLKVLVIANTGKTFLAGADIKEMSGFRQTEARKFSRLFHKAASLIETLHAPVIASVNGFCLGGGLELILACDFVIASKSSVIGAPEINLGIVPGAGGTQRLPARIGKLRAKELILTGRRLYADEAAGIGLINKAVAAEALGEEVDKLARLLADKPVQSVRAAKRLIDAGTFTKEIAEWTRLFSYEDPKRLMEEFLKKSRKE